jgi:hypothetical protein
MSQENCGESDVSITCRYSSGVKKYVHIINFAVSNLIPKKSKRPVLHKNSDLYQICSKMTFT